MKKKYQLQPKKKSSKGQQKRPKLQALKKFVYKLLTQLVIQ